MIAVSLGIIALPTGGPACRFTPRPTIPIYTSNLYVEPQTAMLRKPDGSQQVEGKIVIDMRNGDVWGFAALSGLGLPYQAASCLGTDLSRPI